MIRYLLKSHAMPMHLLMLGTTLNLKSFRVLPPNYSSGQMFTELNPAPSPSGHPLLSGPPT